MKLKADFLQSIEHCQGFDEEAFIASHHSLPVVSIRINQAKVNSCADVIDVANVDSQVPWCDGAFVLKERPSFTLDPLFHAGSYYVQEASSMFLQHVVNQLFDDGIRYKALDLCAAPGGKSTLLAGMQQFGLIVSNEIIQSRVSVLQENIIKWGELKVLVTNNDPNDFQRLPGYFDFVVVDAPCSGSGLFRKDEKAMTEWNADLVDFCAARQKRILHAASETLADGGYLFYSTCSFSEQENEANLDYLIDTGLFESVAIPVEESWNIVHAISEKHGAHGYRFYPHKIKGEGFFCAVLRRTGLSSTNSISYPTLPKSLTLKIDLGHWVRGAEQLHFFQKSEEVFAFDAENAHELGMIASVLKLRKSGLRLGEMIRDEFIPNHELAMSTVRSSLIPHVDLDLKQALQYLRRETLDLGDVPKGWLLVQYKDVALGWIKQVQGKAKNHYPLNWRILMRG
jgi:16S rRNA C967 or C1407 C5-methylase (RsmB/RsmF family)/NOL1/NOP2/fmu family ribosome biogenesis protein